MLGSIGPFGATCSNATLNSCFPAYCRKVFQPPTLADPRGESVLIATIRYQQQTIETQLASPSEETEYLDFVLVGDSHAGSMAAGLTVAAGEYGENVGLISQGRGCLLLSGTYTGTPDEDCEQWQREALSTTCGSEWFGSGNGVESRETPPEPWLETRAEELGFNIFHGAI